MYLPGGALLPALMRYCWEEVPATKCPPRLGIAEDTNDPGQAVNPRGTITRLVAGASLLSSLHFCNLADNKIKGATHTNKIKGTTE